MLLLKTPSGSRLYGLSHSNSDEDWIEVYGWNKSRARQRIVGDQDVLRTSYDRFMRYCDKGVPQYLEAMFSQMCLVNTIKFITDAYVPNMTHVRETYNRTIKNFWMNGVENDDFKRRRHALRLMLNLEAMEEAGRFNPTLTPQQAEMITHLAMSDRTELPIL